MSNVIIVQSIQEETMTYIKLIPELVGLGYSSHGVHLYDVYSDVPVSPDNPVTDSLHLQAQLGVSSPELPATRAGGGAAQ